jgi:hypothetical protein
VSIAPNYKLLHLYFMEHNAMNTHLICNWKLYGSIVVLENVGARTLEEQSRTSSWVGFSCRMCELVCLWEASCDRTVVVVVPPVQLVCNALLLLAQMEKKFDITPDPSRFDAMNSFVTSPADRSERGLCSLHLLPL